MMLKLKSRMNMNIRLVMAVAVPMILVVTSARGVTLSIVGSQYDIGGTFFPGGSPPYVVVPWRSDSSAKPLDADSNNVYGSGGYVLFATQFNWPNVECCGNSVPFDDSTYPNMMNLPAFVDASQNLTVNKVGGWVYALIDDPSLVNGFRDYNWGDTLSPSVGDLTGQPHSQSPYVKIGIVDGTDLLGNDPKTSSFGAGRWTFQVGAGVPSSFRVGVMTDGLDADRWAATEVLVAQVSGSPIPTIVGTPASSGSLTRNRFVDIHFFDIVGAQPGDQFAVFAKASSDGNGAISGITFDVLSSMLPPGDFNGNGAVDAADYVVWRKNDGTQAGYDVWRSHFGQTAGSGAGATANTVPEPPIALLMLVVGILATCSRQPLAVPKT
jgi:hypothetical protein